MAKYYSREQNAQIIVALLKLNGIKNIVASPGSTNVAFIGSVQRDPFFKLYSSVDERSSAYLACGIADETGEPVVISCTGATASRNYMPGLTEAFYRKLPVLAITSTQPTERIGHHVAQVIDRSSHAKDVVKRSFQLPIVNGKDAFWECEVKVNQAIYELSKNGGGPVHINLPTTYDPYFDVKKLPNVRSIRTYEYNSELPELKGKVAVFVGAHKRWTARQQLALERFSSHYGAPVFCDHTSGYKGKNRLLYSLAAGQDCFNSEKFRPDISIHIGEVSGDYHTLRAVGGSVWRVSEDGEIRDTFRKLQCLFNMSEEYFFEEYNKKNSTGSCLYDECAQYLESVRHRIPELKFSNIWVAKELSTKLPESAVVHFGILNSLRSWNFFEVPKNVNTSANTGGFGIDGILSSVVGASFTNPNRLYYCVLGDLAFFYDMNVLGNRHVGNNLRILLINNGKGTEFTNYSHHAARFGESTDEYMAAAGHFGNKSLSLVKNFAESLGFKYLSASSKDEFKDVVGIFADEKLGDQPIVFEIFTDSIDESDTLKSMVAIDKSFKYALRNKIKVVLKRPELSFLLKLVRKFV